ncbi:MAG: ribosome assembly cofactor RimP [Salinivirgaceae bacterium]|nr:ribosome assembly cofactor RimP [Salinivirgaceae bacterium]
MIEKKQIEEIVQGRIEGTDLFLVEVKVDTQNNITVTVDSPEGISVDTCVVLSQYIESQLNREAEDFALEVSSPGVGQPLKVLQQYTKILNGTIEVLFNSGIKLNGILREVSSEGILLEYETKEKPEGAKRPVKIVKTEPYAFSEIKSVKETIIF